jgi:hypothetical protein
MISNTKEEEGHSFIVLQTSLPLIHSYTSSIRIPLNKRATNNGILPLANVETAMPTKARVPLSLPPVGPFCYHHHHHQQQQQQQQWRLLLLQVGIALRS